MRRACGPSWAVSPAAGVAPPLPAGPVNISDADKTTKYLLVENKSATQLRLRICVNISWRPLHRIECDRFLGRGAGPFGGAGGPGGRRLAGARHANPLD